MLSQIIPKDVIRILSFHGPVKVLIGGEEVQARGKVEVAPFEDRVELFLPRKGALVKALLGSCRVEVHARKEGEYSLRMIGRAHAGQAATRHPERASLEPWKPEGKTLQQLVAAPFIPEHLELIRNEAEDRVRYHGRTPAGESRPPWQTVWRQATLGGRSLLMATIAFTAPFGWLVYQGADYLGRPAAMALALVTGIGMVGGSRLWTIQFAYRQWREGRAKRAEASVLADGLMAPDTAARFAFYFGLVGVTGGVLLWSLWDTEIAVIAFFANGAWLAGPASWMHLSARSPERE